MEDLNLYDGTGKSVTNDFEKIGTQTEGVIFYVNKQKLTLEHINSLKNFIHNQEKKLKKENKRCKSAACSMVLQLMDEDLSYQDALKAALAQHSISKEDLEFELNTYI